MTHLTGGCTRLILHAITSIFLVVGGLFSRWKKPAAQHQPPAITDPWDLDAPLFALGDDVTTWRNAFEHTIIFGEIGAAKSTGSGAMYLMGFLQAGAGGIFGCVKPEDASQLQGYMRLAGVSDNLILVEPGKRGEKPRFRCNLLRLALLTAPSKGSSVERVVLTLMTIVEAAERGEKRGGVSDEFWTRSVRQLLRAIVEICIAARGTVSMRMIHDAIMSLPRSPQEVQSSEWQEGSFLYKLIAEAEGNAQERSFREESDYMLSAQYALREYPQIPNDTRGSVLASYSVLADVLLRGDMADLFDSDTNFVPQMTFEGAVICINLPVKLYGQAGLYATGALIYLWQLIAEARDLQKYPRPVWWFQDEAHEAVCDYTARFLATGRSKKVACVLITQNLSNLAAAFGGTAGREAADAIVSNSATKVLHANGHSSTNEWASKTISDEIQVRVNFNSHRQQDAQGGGGGSEQVGHKVLASEFTMLKKGGPQNNFVTEAIIYRTGASFVGNGGQPYLRVTFPQIIPGVTDGGRA